MGCTLKYGTEIYKEVQGAGKALIYSCHGRDQNGAFDAVMTGPYVSLVRGDCG